MMENTDVYVRRLFGLDDKLVCSLKIESSPAVHVLLEWTSILEKKSDDIWCKLVPCM